MFCFGIMLDFFMIGDWSNRHAWAPKPHAWPSLHSRGNFSSWHIYQVFMLGIGVIIHNLCMWRPI